MGKFRFLDLIKPFQYALPEVEIPVKAEYLSFDDRMLYSLGIGIFFIFSQLPIYGVKSVNSDPFFQYRALVGSQSGTLDEFGLLPIITSGFFWQLMAGFRLLSVNFNQRNDRTLFQSLQKVSSILIGASYAFFLVFLTDYYNPGDQFNHAIDYSKASDADILVQGSSFGLKFLIWLQLFVYNVVLTYSVEILDKGYGFTSGSMFLIGVNGGTEFATGLMDFTTVKTPKGYEYKGVLVQLAIVFKDGVTGLFSNGISGFLKDILHLFNRSNAVNLNQIFLAIVSGAAIFYLQAAHQAVSVKPKQAKATAQNYPIKLFYNGALPLVFAVSVFYHAKFLNYVAYKFLFVNPIGRVIFNAIAAQLESDDLLKKVLYVVVGDFDNFGSRSYQTAGVLSYLQTPLSLKYAILHPLQTLAFSSTLVGLIGFFSSSWSKMSGSSGKDIAETLSSQNITIMGRRDTNVAHVFNKIVSGASSAGAITLAAFSVGNEVLGGQGFPSGVVASVLISFTFLESFLSEYQQSSGSLFSNAFKAVQ